MKTDMVKLPTPELMALMTPSAGRGKPQCRLCGTTTGGGQALGTHYRHEHPIASGVLRRYNWGPTGLLNKGWISRPAHAVIGQFIRNTPAAKIDPATSDIDPDYSPGDPESTETVPVERVGREYLMPAGAGRRDPMRKPPTPKLVEARPQGRPVSNFDRDDAARRKDRERKRRHRRRHGAGGAMPAVPTGVEHVSPPTAAAEEVPRQQTPRINFCPHCGNNLLAIQHAIEIADEIVDDRRRSR